MINHGKDPFDKSIYRNNKSFSRRGPSVNVIGGAKTDAHEFMAEQYRNASAKKHIIKTTGASSSSISFWFDEE